MKFFFKVLVFSGPPPSYLTKLGRPTPEVAQKKLVTHPPTKTSNADVDITLTYSHALGTKHWLFKQSGSNLGYILNNLMSIYKQHIWIVACSFPPAFKSGSKI